MVSLYVQLQKQNMVDLLDEPIVYDAWKHCQNYTFFIDLFPNICQSKFLANFLAKVIYVLMYICSLKELELQELGLY